LVSGFKKKVKALPESELEGKNVNMLQKRRRKPHMLDPCMEAINKFVMFEKAKLAQKGKIKWTDVAKKMKTRSRDDCRNRWF
jgi:hypothetical protein